MSGLACPHVVRRCHDRLPAQLKLSLGITAALSTLLATENARAQQWTGAVDSDVTNSNNWNPAPTDYFGDVVINTGTNAAVWTAGGPIASQTIWGSSTYWNVSSLSVGSGGAGQFTFNVASGNTDERAYVYASNGTALAVGTGGSVGNGTFNLRYGTEPGISLQLANSYTEPGFVVGMGAGSQGTVNVLGSGKVVQSQSPYGRNQFSAGKIGSQASGNVVGGAGGTGTVNVQDGALVFDSSYNPDALPMFSIGDGAGSHGQVNVLSGGKLAINPSYASSDPLQSFVVGRNGGTGVLSVSGANAGGYSSKVTVGYGIDIGSGAGSHGGFNVLAGGKAANYQLSDPGPGNPLTTARIGVDGGTGDALVSGANSVWYVGSVAVNDYYDNDTGTTTPGDVYPYNIGDLHVGASGTGTLTIADGGVVSLGALHEMYRYSYDDQTQESLNWFQLSQFDDGLGTLHLAEAAGSTGTLNIGAAAGQSAAAPGTLKAAQIDLGPGTATVAFNHTASDYVFSVPLVGAGILASYAGTTYLQPASNPPAGAATDSSGFSGTTAIYGGALGLRYNAALGTSSVSVLGAGGGLIYGNGTLITNTIDITGGATLTASNENGTSATQAAVISGAGNLARSGPGTVALTAVNTYTGETDIHSGTLALVGNGSIAQSSRVVADGTFDISAANPDPFIVSLAGSGVVNLGASQLTLTAANDTFAGQFTGSGPLTLAAGNEVLTGNSSGYTGNTTVAGGSLWINGTLGAATTSLAVDSGGRLGGGGTVGGNVSIAGGGYLTPGAAALQPGLLSIGGNLALAPGAILEYDFGQANTPGGTFNDLIRVDGNLTLAGTINITEAPGGTFEPGIYRVIDYGGTLTDLGLSIGTTPVSGLQVLTAIPQQVDLVYVLPGIPLSFWDGDAGPKNNALIDGGNGTWQASAGNDNWTNVKGTPNAPFADGAFAVFAGAPGTVTVDNSLGPVTVAGLQFATSGYVLQGDAITLSGSTAYVRVGEGLSRQLLKNGVPVATINAPITGSAQLVKDDVGTLVLGGINTYTGGTRLQGGTLQVSADDNLGIASGGVTLATGALENTASFTSARRVTVENAGEINTDSGTTLTLSGALEGNGALLKSGAGTLDVAGGGGFIGPALVSGGSLSVDGVLAGATVTMAQGTSLIGNGTVGTTTLQAGSSIAPGHSIGTLTVQGNYMQSAGAVYQVQLDPASANADLIQVQGAATLAPGAALQVSRIANTTYALGTRYTVLDASGGLTGTYTLGGELAVSPFATLQDSYDANHAYLQVNQTRALTDLACSRNANGTAAGLQSTGTDNAALNAIVMQSTSDADACHSLGELSGEAYASLRGIFIDDSRFLREAVSYRMRGDANTAASAGNDVVGANGLWGHAFGSWGNYDAHNDTASMDRDIGGFFVGGDRDLGGWRLGALAGYSHTSFHLDGLDSSGSSDDYHLGVYVGNDQGSIRVHGGVAYSWHDVSMTRHPSFAGYSASLSSDFDAGTAQAWGEIAYDMPGRDADLQPFFNAAYVRLRTNGLQEEGDTAAALSGRGEHSSNTFSTLGARLTSPLGLSDHSSLELRMSAGWRHAYGQLSPSAVLQFVGGTPFGVVGAPLDRDALAVDVGVGGRLSRDWDGGVSYSGVIGSNSGDHGVKAYVRWQF
jgi:fibronectin-binding autotransporter adhesin